MKTEFENLLPQRYQVTGELGRGGAGVVLRAEDVQTDRTVAVKISLSVSGRERFRHEAEQLANLSHPNVVKFFEAGCYNDQDYIVLEYVHQGDLGKHVKNLDTQCTLDLFIQVCHGLSYLHRKGIVHRDLKPANILIGSDGRPKITDLGLARLTEKKQGFTQSGTILGTYSYLAPEQIISSSVGPKADLYSLGICLYIALAGRHPFQEENEFCMLQAHLEKSPPALSEFLPTAPASLNTLLQELLAKDETDRPESARIVAGRLEEILSEFRNSNSVTVDDKKLEELSEDERSVLLAVTYLGEKATLERVCHVAYFPARRTVRCLEKLMKRTLLKGALKDSFSLAIPEDLVQERLSPRVRRLFAQRLSKSGLDDRADWDPDSSSSDDDDWLVAVAGYQESIGSKVAAL